MLLAGLATPRHGVLEVLKVLEKHPDWRLRVLVGEGLEPERLLDHPQVSPAQGFEGIGVVVAPSWVECYPSEIGEALGRGLPVVASLRAAGCYPVREVVPGDLDGLSVALMEARGERRRRVTE